MLVSYRLVVMVAVTLLLAGCRHQTISEMMGRPECPDHEFRPRDDKGNIRDPVVLHLVDEGTGIPEFNDCQALVEGGGYGPLVAIFARQRALPPVLSAEQLYFVAVIFNYGKLNAPDVRYGPLSIEPGVSCLYLPLASATIRGARLVPNRGNLSCPDSISSHTTYNLEARIRPRDDPSHNVPKAARWDWDAVRAEHYIGVACGAEWCEIGKSGFTSADDPDTRWVNTIPGLTLGEVHDVRGYFDEQVLALNNPEGTPADPLSPGAVRATFFPAPNLEAIVDFNDYRYVGTMIASGTQPEYQEKFGLIADTPTHIYIKRRRPFWMAFGGKNHMAKFETGENVITIPIKRRAHSEMAIPPMVRWRWLWTDETTWIRCLEGCCSTQ
jgi:hypothetical protein